MAIDLIVFSSSPAFYLALYFLVLRWEEFTFFGFGGFEVIKDHVSERGLELSAK